MYLQGLDEHSQFMDSVATSQRCHGGPLLSCTWRLPDGRRLGYADLGAAHGFPLVYLHNHASSRLEALFFHEQACAAGFRLIAVDRPGLGLSDFLPYRHPSVFADDVLCLADHLGLSDFGLLCWGGGSPFALALSWRHPERVSFMLGVAAVAPPGPGSLGQSVLRGASVRMMRLLVRLRYHMLANGGGAGRYLERMQEQLCHADRKMLQNPGVMELLQRDLRESMRQGPRGMSHDSAAGMDPWDFALEDVRVPVQLWQGTADTLVSAVHGERLARQLNECVLHRVRHRGHFLFLHEGAEIFARARSVMAGVRRSG